MKTQNHTPLYIVTGMLCFALIFGGWINFSPKQSEAQPGINAQLKQNPHDLATVFRDVSKEVLPGVVSIVTQTKSKVVKQDKAPKIPFNGDPLLEDLFKNDPRLKELFKPNSKGRKIPSRRGQGSGFIIKKSGLIVTNAHVVEGADIILVRLHDGREFKATAVKIDSRTDLAILKVNSPAPLPVLPLGNSDNMEIGDWVLAVGSPFGLELSVTTGIISAKGRGPRINEREHFLQTDAAVNPGNSGGPLINLDGEVIGINSAITSRNGGNDGIAFAIPINMAKWVVQQLELHGEVQRAYIGVVIQKISNDLATQLHTKVGHGVLVSQVREKAPAQLAGLLPGDVILKLAGHKVNGTHELQGIVEKLSIEKSYPLEIIRNGKSKTLNIKMQAMPKDYTLTSRQGSAFKKKGSSAPNKIGIETTELTSDLAKQFGTDAKEGVLVKSVQHGSLAQSAGIQSGDVIEKVGNKPISSVDQFEKELKNADLSKGIMLLLRSKNSSRFIILKKE